MRYFQSYKNSCKLIMQAHPLVIAQESVQQIQMRNQRMQNRKNIESVDA